MQIIIRIFEGETFTQEINDLDLVFDVKKLIGKRLGFENTHMRLLLRGRPLQEVEKLSDNNVQDGTQFDLIHRQ